MSIPIQNVDQLKNRIDQDVTSKTTRRSVTPIILGTLLKVMTDFIVGLIGNSGGGSGPASQITRRYKNDVSNPLTTATNGRVLTMKPNTKDTVKLPQTSEAPADQARFLIPITDFPKRNTTYSNVKINMNGAQVGTNINVNVLDVLANSNVGQHVITGSQKFRNVKVRVDFPSNAPIEPPTQTIQIGANISTPNPTDGNIIAFVSYDVSFDKVYIFRDTPTEPNEIQIGVDIGSTLYNLNQYLLSTGYFETSGIVNPLSEYNYAYKFLHLTEEKRYVDGVYISTFPTVGWTQQENTPLNVTLGNAALAIKAKIDNAENVLVLQSYQDINPHPVISWYDLFHRTYNANTPFGQIFNTTPQAGAFGYYWFNNGNAALYDVIMNTANGGYSFTSDNGFIWETSNPPVDDNDTDVTVTLDYYDATSEVLQTGIASTTDAWLIGEDDEETLNNLKTYLDSLDPAYYTTAIDTENNTITLTANNYSYNFSINGDLQILETNNYDASQLINYVNNGNNGVYQSGLGIGNYQLYHPSFFSTISTNRTKGTEVTINGQTYKLCDTLGDYIDNVIECYVSQNSSLLTPPDHKYILTKTVADGSIGIIVDTVGISSGYVSWQYGSQFDAYFGEIEYLEEFVPELKKLVRETAIGVQVGIDDGTGEVIVSPLININEVEMHPDVIEFLESLDIEYNGIEPPTYATGNPDDLMGSLYIVWDEGYVIPVGAVLGMYYNGDGEDFMRIFNNAAFTAIKGTTNATTKFEAQLFTNLLIFNEYH